MKTLFTILFLLVGFIASAQKTTVVTDPAKITWNPNYRAVTDVQIKLWNSPTILEQAPGITLKRLNDSTVQIGLDYPLKMTTRSRDTINIKASRGTMIYNLDKDSLEISNGVKWRAL